MNNEGPITANGDGAVDAALAEYLLRRERGESVDLTALIAAYPGCEAEVRKFIAQERDIHRVMVADAPANAPAQDLDGRTLGDFRLLRILGRGGMGIVWEAEQISLRRKVAVKLLPGALCADPRHRTRFQNEARILAQLEHPNIVNVIAVGEEADTYFFAMQYVDGMTVDDWIRGAEGGQAAGGGQAQFAPRTPQIEPVPDAPRDHRGDGARPVPDGSAQRGGQAQFVPKTPQIEPVPGNRHERYRLCARIAHDIASALAHAHACGVLHRDVKPSNILLDKNGTARLTDFGLARMYGDATLTATGMVLGTLRYASPEQLSGTHHVVDERSDVYSLGATLWEMVTGKRLFAAEDHNSVITQVLKVEAPRPTSVAAGLPRDLETIIARAMAKVPADRYTSAQTLADDLQRFLDGRPILARPFSLGERAFRWANRNRSLTTTAVAALVVLALGAIVSSALILHANSRTATALATSQINEESAQQSAAAAQASERKTRELLYAADMALAGAAWKKNEPAQVRMILDRYAQPKTRVDGSTEDDLRGYEWHFLDRQIRPQSELLFQNDKALYLIEFMPDGKEFFTAGQDSIVRWHHASTGKVLRSLDTQQREINGVSYNPAGTLFATVGEDGTVKIWNAAERTLLQTINAHKNLCYFAKFVDDEQVLTGAAHEPAHRLFNAATGKLIREYVTPEAFAAGIGNAGSVDAYISRSKSRVWMCSNSRNREYKGIYEWELGTNECRRILDYGGIQRVLSDRSEKFLFIQGIDGYVRVLDAQSGDERWSARLDNRPEAIALSPDQRRLAVGDKNGQVRFWNLDLSNADAIVASTTPRMYSVHKQDVFGMVFTSDGKSLLTTSSDGSVRRTPLEAPEEAFREVAWMAGRWPCAAIPGTNRLIVGSPLAIHDRSSGALIKTISTAPYHAAAVSSDGRFAAAASTTQLGVWEIATGAQIMQLNLERKPILGVDFSPNNSQLAVVGYDGTWSCMDVVEIATGTLARYTARENWSRLGLFVADSGLIEMSHQPNQLTHWIVPEHRIRWRTNAEVAGRLARSADRKLLLACGTRELQLIEAATGAVRYQLPCDFSIEPIEFLADGRSAVVAGTAGQVSLWNVATGQQMFEVANVGESVRAIVPLDDGFMVRVDLFKGKKDEHWLEF